MFGQLPESAYSIAILLGLGLILIDILILGAGTIVLTAAGVGLLVISVFLYADVIQTWGEVLLVYPVLVAVLVFVLWKPLKNFTKSASPHKTTTDYHGLEFDLPDNLMKGSSVSYKYSGITWQLQSDTDIPAGTKVKVVDVMVGKWFVEPA